MKIVLDANVYVSALLTKTGSPKQILDFWEQGRFELFVSAEILAELDRVLRYSHIRKIHKQDDTDIDRFIELLAREATVVAPVTQLAVATDESDNRYLECAVQANASYLVTGDKKHLLPIGHYRGIDIVPPALFVAILSSELN